MDARELNKVLATTPVSKKIMILILIILVLVLLGHYYIYKPKATKIMILEPEITKLKKTLQENLEITKGIKDIDQDIRSGQWGGT
jgi:Tfp pilus assembly protein PilO